MESLGGAEAEAFLELAEKQSEVFEKLLHEVKCARNYFANLIKIAVSHEDKNEEAEQFARDIHTRLCDTITEAEVFIVENEKACQYLEKKYGAK